MKKAISQEIQDLLAGHGIESEVKRRRKHTAVKFKMDGQQRTYFCPSSASDRRAVLNCLADIRRLMRHGMIRN